MAFSAGTANYKAVDESGTIGGVSYVDVDYVLSNGSTTTHEKLLPVYQGEYIQVYGLQILRAGTATAVTDVGIAVAGGEIDEDGFIADAAVGGGTPGDLVPAGGAYAAAGGYLNATAAVAYLATINDTAADVAGKVRIFYKKWAMPLAVAAV
jgi:hypothetical protein